MAYKALSELTCIFLLLSLPFPLLWTGPSYTGWFCPCLLYTSDAADDWLVV